MPGPALHHLIVDRLRGRIQAGGGLGDSLGPTDYDALQALLADPKNLPYLFMGCQGPDMFFFNTKDMHPAIGTFVEIHNDVADFLRDFEEALLEAVPQPVLDALAAFEEAANEVIEDSVLLSEIKQTFEDLNAMLTAFAAVLEEAIKKYVTEFDLFDLLSHPYRDGAAEGDWWWFDALHYRKTGQIAAELLEATRDMSSPLHLYALGYLTHVTGDTVGHPYVNLYSGGPYRNHGQRHKTGENFQDVFNLLGERGIDWNYSRLHALYNFEHDGTGEPPENPRLPADLADLLADVLNRVYQADADPDPDYASRISASDVDDTYRLWYRFMRGFTEANTLPPPVPYSFTAEMREVWEKAMDNLDDVGDFLEDAVDTAGDFGILSIFIVLGALIAAAVLAAAAIADAVAGAIATLGTATIRYLACLIYEQLYNAFQSFRLAIALNGLAFPMREHLTEPRFAQFITPAVRDSTGTNAADIFGRQPLLPFTPAGSDPLAAIFHRERHLVYPPSDGEREAATAAPTSYLTALPTHYAFGRIPVSGEFLQELVDLADSAPRGEPALQGVIEDESLGNALDLTRGMYERWFEGLPLPDFNLDADRGYAYLCWRQDADPPHEPDPLVTQPRVDLEVLPE